MGLQSCVRLEIVDLMIEARHQGHWDPSIDDGRRGALRPSRFFPEGRLLRLWRRGTRSGGAGTSRVRGHPVFLLPDQGRLPSLVSPIQPIVVV